MTELAFAFSGIAITVAIGLFVYLLQRLDHRDEKILDAIGSIRGDVDVVRALMNVVARPEQFQAAYDQLNDVISQARQGLEQAVRAEPDMIQPLLDRLTSLDRQIEQTSTVRYRHVGPAGMMKYGAIAEHVEMFEVDIIYLLQEIETEEANHVRAYTNAILEKEPQVYAHRFMAVSEAVKRGLVEYDYEPERDPSSSRIVGVRQYLRLTAKGTAVLQGLTETEQQSLSTGNTTPGLGAG